MTRPFRPAANRASVGIEVRCRWSSGIAGKLGTGASSWSPSQARALHELDLERLISMRELAERLKSDPSNVTGVIDRLETRGLVQHRPDPADRRIKALALTSAGAKLRERLF